MKLLSVIFQWVISSSLMASILICIILLLKSVLKDKVSASWNHYIWFLVVLKLIIPYAPESSISIFNVLPSVNKNISFRKERTIIDRKEPNNLIFSREANEDTVEQNEVIAEKKYDFQSNNVVYKKINKNLNPKEYLTRIRKVIPPSSISGGNYLNKYTNVGVKSPSEGINNSIVDDALMLIWISGIIILLSYTIVINLFFFKRVQKNNKINNSIIDRIFNESKDIMAINKNIPIIYAKEIYTPSLMGIIKPKLLIPENLIEQISNEEFKYIFLHELAHLKRKDILVNWIIVLLQIVHWFNPFIWYGFYKMRNDCEVACDSLAISFLEQEECKKYGLTIIHLLEFMKTINWVPGMTGMLKNKSNIKRRISMISMFRKKSFKYTWAAIIIFIIIGAVTLTNAKDKSKSELLKNNIYNQINYEIDKDSQMNKMLLGEVDVKGEGVSIKLSNSEILKSSINVDYRSVRIVVNELINAGAEVISVNDERVLANSEIVSLGGDIIINGNKLSYPFIIEAIGDKKKLYLIMASVEAYDKIMGIDFHIEQVDNLIIPKMKKQNLKENQILLGTMNVKGRGISITLKDSEGINNTIMGTVSNLDVRNVVTSLIDNGAEAISVNEERIVLNSEIICNGMSLVINGNDISHPFTIKAIGDADLLYPATGNEDLESLKERGVQIAIEKCNEIVIPKIKKEIKLKYTQMVESNK